MAVIKRKQPENLNSGTTWDDAWLKSPGAFRETLRAPHPSPWVGLWMSRDDTCSAGRARFWRYRTLDRLPYILSTLACRSASPCCPRRAERYGDSPQYPKRLSAFRAHSRGLAGSLPRTLGMWVPTPTSYSWGSPLRGNSCVKTLRLFTTITSSTLHKILPKEYTGLPDYTTVVQQWR